MKKTILFALIAVGLTVSFFVGISVSQEQRAARDSQKAQNELQIQIAQKAFETAQQRKFGGGFDLIDDTVEAKMQGLRKELLQLFQLHLPTMNDEELIAAITDLRKELGEHEAKAKLRQAEKLLQKILKTYPQSRAAKQARRMLETKGEFGEEGGAEAEPAATINEADNPTTE